MKLSVLIATDKRARHGEKGGGIHLGTDSDGSIRATEAGPLRTTLNIKKTGTKAFKPSTGLKAKRWNGRSTKLPRQAPMSCLGKKKSKRSREITGASELKYLKVLVLPIGRYLVRVRYLRVQLPYLL